MNIRRDSGRKLFVYLSMSSIALAAIGCSGQTPVPRDARAAGEWTFRLPETQSPYAGLAIAHGNYEPSALSMVDEALAETPAPKAARPQPSAKRAVVAKAEPTQAAPVAAPIAELAVVQPQPEQLALNAPATKTSDEQRYSQREQQSQKQRDFRGGDAIVISASALVVILLVVILVLLLT